MGLRITSLQVIFTCTMCLLSFFSALSTLVAFCEKASRSTLPRLSPPLRLFSHFLSLQMTGELAALEASSVKSKVGLFAVWRGSSSLHCVSHVSALVWAWLRACLVSLPSSIPFPDFCVCSRSDLVCVRAAAGGFGAIFKLNTLLIILCRVKQHTGMFDMLKVSEQMSICEFELNHT